MTNNNGMHQRASFSTRKYIWPEKMNNKSYRINAFLSGIEVLRRRQKSDLPCKETLNYDNWVYENFTRYFGCKPPYWNQIQNAPICDKKVYLRSINAKN